MKYFDLFSKCRPFSHWTKLLAAGLMAAALVACGGGSDGAPGAKGDPGAPGAGVDPAVVNDLTAKITALTQAANPETCVTCHTGATPVAASGSLHQAKYAELYQADVIKISDMAFSAVGTTATLTFKMTGSAGVTPDCTKAAPGFSIGSSWVPYDISTKTFLNATPSYTYSLIGTKAWNAATSVCTITKTGLSTADVTRMAGNGEVVVYGVDGIQSNDPVTHFIKGNYPFAGILEIGTVDYTSAANVSACESCHTTPFFKHGYIAGTVTDNAGNKTLFQVCKACHMDDGAGGHQVWQLEGDYKALLNADPKSLQPATVAAGLRLAAVAGGAALTTAETTKYAYKKRLMNDVHMSHAMEFPYPQSMKNCVTCHAGKLDTVLADDKFKAETCISCHSVEGIKTKMKAAPFNHSDIVATDAALRATDCTGCHKSTYETMSFKSIHGGGYDPKIYTTTGVRYSDNYKIIIDSTTVAANKLTIKFHATEAVAIAGLSKNSITPTVLVGLYGYDTKDFIVGPHLSQPDKSRNLEYIVGGAANPRFTTVTAANGSWEVTADLSLWADKITAGVVKRAEIAVLPELKHPTLLDPESTTTPKAKLVLGLNAPSKTFDLTKNAFVAAPTTPIIKSLVDANGNTVKTACNTCHDQLATTFHSGIRGGSVVVCRLCHEVSSPGSHLEMQSRSIDSYVHAIHSFQAFDLEGRDLTDPVQLMEYKAHTGTDYPKFGIQDCESCHNPGTYDVPNQAKSMPGVLSGNETLKGGTRNIGTIPSYVTGPAVRACGSCHRSQMITSDDANGLAVLNAHFKQNGYMVEVETGLWDSIVAKIMTVFK